MKLLLLLTLLIISCNAQDQKNPDCIIYPISIEEPIPDIIKLKLNGAIQTIQETTYHISNNRALKYLKFNDRGFLIQEINDEPFNEDTKGIAYNDDFRLKSQGVISNYTYKYKNDLVENFTRINSTFEVDAQNNLLILEIEKYKNTYVYDSISNIINYKLYGHSTDSMAVNTESPILEVNINYENGKIKNAIENYLYFGKNKRTNTWEYNYDREQVFLIEKPNDEATKTYINCKLRKETFADKYSDTERIYDDNGNQITVDISYKDGDKLHASMTYDEANNLKTEERFVGPILEYVYEFDRNNNWTNKKMIRASTGEVIVESKRIITYYP